MSVVASRTLLPAAVSASGTVGAVVGATVAAARDIKRVNDGTMTKSEAATDIGLEAVGTGLSTAAGVAVVGAAGIGGLLGLAGIVGVAAGTKYLWNRTFGGRAASKTAES
ncbi:hypothetical protein [Maridesulfovibrio sp.]|uniref:hypothetical protein n=1 Tax=Maridesulfovibrio sp. TaxID=2795000 RepID=UPI002A188C41|nr:hypothetical protein [Maridesulfovibrio sp.]